MTGGVFMLGLAFGVIIGIALALWAVVEWLEDRRT